MHTLSQMHADICIVVDLFSAVSKEFSLYASVARAHGEEWAWMWMCVCVCGCTCVLQIHDAEWNIE